jgi:hypothetical protein
LETATLSQEKLQPLPVNIDPHKVDKYLPKLTNGEAFKIETWLPNILSTGGLMEREKYDYRIGQFKAKDRVGYNSRIAVVLQKLEKIKLDRAAWERQLELDRLDLVAAFGAFKVAVDGHHEKLGKQAFL